MKKYIFILIAIFCLSACEEDESRDITVMPPVTEEGADTFGCLVDGWLYVGGRYQPMAFKESFVYNTAQDKLSARVWVKNDKTIDFTILSPQKGKECVLTDITFGEEELENGTAFISRFDPSAHIISGTFENKGRLTHGRFDIHYVEVDYPETPPSPEVPPTPEGEE